MQRYGREVEARYIINMIEEGVASYLVGSPQLKACVTLERSGMIAVVPRPVKSGSQNTKPVLESVVVAKIRVEGGRQ